MASVLSSADMNAFAAKTAFEYAGRKFCKDCIYHGCDHNGSNGKIKHYCKAENLSNIITGLPSDPAVNRNTLSLCGQDGKYWMPRVPSDKAKAE